MGDKEFITEGMKFESVLQTNVPKGREGKHKEIITQLLCLNFRIRNRTSVLL
jgi:hypothetical protein